MSMMTLMMSIIIMYPLFLTLLTLNMFYLKYYIYHPINQMMMLILLVISLSFYLYLKNENSIYPMLLMITFISGILVVFSYFTALNNKPNYIINNYIIYIMLLMLLIMIYLMINDKFIYFNLYEMLFNKNMTIIEIFMSSKIYIYFMLVIKLIITLYLSIKICLIKNQSLRSN